MKIILVLAFLSPFVAAGQTVSTADYHHFFQMRDSLKTVSDSADQVAIIQRLYIDKASEGLTAFMRNKSGLDKTWLTLLRARPAFWDSLEKELPLVDRAAGGLDKQIKHFRSLYPALKQARSFFLVGICQQGGTIRGNLSLIGTEVVLSREARSEQQLIRMGLHEYIHTQQSRPDFQHIDVLTSSIREGACDFVASLVSGILTKEPYTIYGRKHEHEVWEAFQKDMYTDKNDNWVSTGNNPALPAPDLGYYVGYRICASYYSKAKDKTAALKAIIELNYADTTAVRDFLKTANYRGGK